MTEKDFYVKLGKRCRQVREDKGITPSAMVKKSGVARSMLYEFETSGKKISAWNINKILNVLELPTLEENFDSKKKLLPFMFDGDELEQMDNGERKDFLAKVMTFVRLVFSEEVLMEVAKEFQDEYDESRRNAADKQRSRQANGNGQLNHC